MLHRKVKEYRNSHKCHAKKYNIESLRACTVSSQKSTKNGYVALGGLLGGLTKVDASVVEICIHRRSC